MQELRLAIRRLRKRPAATFAAVLTLATALSAAAATWSIVSSVVIRPLPVSEPDRLVVLEVSHPNQRFPYTGHLYPEYQAVRQSSAFEATAAGGRWALPLAANGASSIGIVYFASGSFFRTLGVPAALGRTIEAGDDRREAPLVAVVSERFWQRRFGGDPRVIGKTLVVNDQLATIVGVAARRFRGLNLSEAPELYLALEKAGEVVPRMTNVYSLPNHPSSPNAWLTVIGRLPRGVAAQTIGAQVQTLLAPPGSRSTGQYALLPLSAAALPVAARPGIRQFTRLLAGTVALLVLIGCVSVATLLLIRTEARRSEFATCMALGASRARLGAGVALEGAVTAIAAAVLAVPITSWLFAGLAGFQLPGGVNLELLELSIDREALAAISGVAFAATLVVAVIAAFLGFTGSVMEALRSRSGATLPVARLGTHRTLVSVQVAGALVLLAGAGLFGRSLAAAMSLNAEVQPERILSATVAYPVRGTPAAVVDDSFAAFTERLRANAVFTRVGAAGFTSSMGDGGNLRIDDQPRRCPTMVTLTGVDGGYFAALGLRARAGRELSAEDSSNAPLVAVVSESFARLMLDGKPLGRRITMPFSRMGRPADAYQVVGVVSDVVTNVNVLEPLAVYMPLAQTWPASSRTIVLQAAADVDAARREALTAIREFDPQSPPPAILSLQERLGRQMGPQRLGAYVLGALGTIAILLTIVGTYVLAESMAVIRGREMAIRAALGARGGQLIGLVLKETVVLVAVGLGGGLLLAWAGAASIRALLYHVHPLDPLTLVATTAAILATTVAVTLGPALRAGRVDLGSVLRAE